MVHFCPEGKSENINESYQVVIFPWPARTQWLAFMQKSSLGLHIRHYFLV